MRHASCGTVHIGIDNMIEKLRNRIIALFISPIQLSRVIHFHFGSFIRCFSEIESISFGFAKTTSANASCQPILLTPAYKANGSIQYRNIEIPRISTRTYLRVLQRY